MFDFIIRILDALFGIYTADAAETTEAGVTGEADESAQSGDGAQPTAQDASAGEDQESEAAQQ